MAEIERPEPLRTEESAFFWDAAANGELRFQVCSECLTMRHPPAAVCGKCFSHEWHTVKSPGLGVVYSYAIPRHPTVPVNSPDTVFVVVEMEEGVRVASNLVDIDPQDVEIGMPVEVCFRRDHSAEPLPLFRPIEQGA